MKNKLVCLLLASLIIAIICTPVAYAQAVRIEIGKYDPTPAETGEYVDVWLDIENAGASAIPDLFVRVEPEYPFSFEDPADTGIEEIGLLQQSMEVRLHYRLRVAPDALSDYYELTIFWKECSGCSWASMERTIVVESMAVNFEVGSVSSEPLRMKPGDSDVKLTVEVQNIGSGKAENVIANLELPEGFEASESYSDQVNLGTIDTDGCEDAIFYIDVEKGVSVGEHVASLILDYTTEEGIDYKQESIDVRIPVKAAPLFEIESVETSPASIKTGDSVSMRIRLRNIGNEEAESVTLRVMPKSGQPFSFEEKSNYVGTLAPNEIGDAVLQFTVDRDAEVKTHHLDVQVRATGDKEAGDDNVYVYTKSVSFEVTGKDSRELYVIGGICVVILLLVGYHGWRKKKK